MRILLAVIVVVILTIIIGESLMLVPVSVSNIVIFLLLIAYMLFTFLHN